MWRAHSDGPFSSAQRGVTGCQRISRQVSRHFLAYSVLVFFLRGSGCFKQHFVAPIHSLSLNSSILLTLFTLVYVINLTCAFCRVSASAGVSFEISRSCNSSSIKILILFSWVRSFSWLRPPLVADGAVSPYRTQRQALVAGSHRH